MSEAKVCETTGKRLMTQVDFLNLPTVDLIGWWIFHECDSAGHRDEPEDYTKMVAAYEGFGREGVASILGSCGYPAGDVEPKVICLSAAKGILTKMKQTQDQRIFSAVFVKREDNSLRYMQCRFGVTQYLRGGKAAYDEKEQDLKIVWDINAPPSYNKAEQAKINAGEMEPRAKGAFRTIALEHLIRLTVGGKQYIIEENKDLVKLIPS